MAMPPGNVVMPDKMQFPAGAGGGGGVGLGGNEIPQHQHHPRPQWFHMDERDGFISWLRGEFAAANAIIDSLCHHLRLVGEPGEYDLVIGSVQQRRCNWNPVLHMQQYFSVAEVVFALQQVASRRQQQNHNHNHSHSHSQSQSQSQRYFYDQAKVGPKDFKRSSGAGYNKGQRGTESVKEVVNYSVESHRLDGKSSGNVGSERFEELKPADGDGEKLEYKDLPLADDKKDATAIPLADNHVNVSGQSEGNLCSNLATETLTMDDQPNSKENNPISGLHENDKETLTITPKVFTATEVIAGKAVNVVDGLKLYEQFYNQLEVSKLVSLINDLRAAGRRGQFQGQTYVVSKRPMKGHGREMIQLGLPIADSPMEEENAAGSSKDRRIEPIPPLLQDVIERMIRMQVTSTKPDSCIIDIYNEGDHSQPHTCPSWFGKPVSILFLTECDLTFGRVIASEHPGDYRGSLKLSLAPGSLLVMQGKSSDFARHAIPTLRKQRILVTFVRFEPKKFVPNDGQRIPSTAPSSHWAPPSSRSPNHIRHPGPKHYGSVPTTGVLTAPLIRPQAPPPNGVQPLFVTAPLAAPMPFPAPVPIPPVSTGWATALPRHPSARIPVPVPGTGVFLPPPGSGNGTSPGQLSTTASEMNFPVEATSLTEKENGQEECNHATNASPKEKSDGKSQRQESNGVMDGQTVKKEEHHQSVDQNKSAEEI